MRKLDGDWLLLHVLLSSLVRRLLRLTGIAVKIWLPFCVVRICSWRTTEATFRALWPNPDSMTCSFGRPAQICEHSNLGKEHSLSEKYIQSKSTRKFIGRLSNQKCRTKIVHWLYFYCSLLFKIVAFFSSYQRRFPSFFSEDWNGFDREWVSERASEYIYWNPLTYKNTYTCALWCACDKIVHFRQYPSINRLERKKSYSINQIAYP